MILIYAPRLPPQCGGVGDHVLACARAMHACGAPVRVAGRTGDPSRFAPVPCRVGIEAAGRGKGSLRAAAAEARARWVVLHWVPSLYGRHGLAFPVVRAAGGLRRDGVRVALVVHEPFLPLTRPAWWALGAAQRIQLRALARHSHRILTPVPAWAEALRRWARRDTVTDVIPIGSTIPLSRLTREQARERLGLGEEDLAVGVFSPGAAGFLASWIVRARKMFAGFGELRWFLLGKGSEALARACREIGPVEDLGRLRARVVGDVVRGLDLLLAPYQDGLTLRRTAAWVGPQHAVATLSTKGPLHDARLTPLPFCAGDGSRADDAAVFNVAMRILIREPESRGRMASLSARFYRREASVEVLARRLARELLP